MNSDQVTNEHLTIVSSFVNSRMLLVTIHPLANSHPDSICPTRNHFLSQGHLMQNRHLTLTHAIFIVQVITISLLHCLSPHRTCKCTRHVIPLTSIIIWKSVMHNTGSCHHLSSCHRMGNSHRKSSVLTQPPVFTRSSTWSATRTSVTWHHRVNVVVTSSRHRSYRPAGHSGGASFGQIVASVSLGDSEQTWLAGAAPEQFSG